MELEYRVRGADGKEYGPATLEQLSEWVQQGRLRERQEVRRSDMEYWAPAGDFTELKPLYQQPVSLPPAFARQPVPTSSNDGQSVLLPQVRSAASWFYWIAGLSLINSLAAVFNLGFRFFFGLGITQVFDAIASKMGSGGQFVALLLDVLAAAVLVLLGVFAHKGQLWPFIVGVILMAADSIVFVLVGDWLGIAVHAFLLFVLGRGAWLLMQMSGKRA